MKSAPVEIVQTVFPWAREQAKSAERIARDVRMMRERLETEVAALESSEEHAAMQNAAEVVKAAVKGALDGDDTYREATEALKAARKALRRLAHHGEAKRLRKEVKEQETYLAGLRGDVTKALATGKVPSQDPIARQVEEQAEASRAGAS